MKLALMLLIALGAPTKHVRVRSVDNVAAFSEDGRSALISRTGFTTGGGNSQSWLLISLDHDPQLVEISNVGVNGNIALQLVEQRDCNDNAKKLQELVREKFFGVVNIDISACLRPGRDVVDIRKNLRIRPLEGDAINALIEKHGVGNFVASPDGPLVVRLVGDFEGNITVARPIEGTR
jgi:hypothetical protein